MPASRARKALYVSLGAAALLVLLRYAAPGAPDPSAPASERASAPGPHAEPASPGGSAQPAMRAPGASPSPDPTSTPAPRADSSAGNRVDPTRQPRAFWVVDFQSSDPLKVGYQLEGLESTRAGLTLAAATGAAPRHLRTSDRVQAAREGRLTSPAIALDFPANAFTPLWKAELPPDAKFAFDLSVSSDGTTWSRWYDLEPDPDSEGLIEPTMPDGRPNPNHGYVPGRLLALGLTLWSHVRFRVQLSAETPDPVILKSLRLYYQDSTLGQGRTVAPQ